MARIVVAGSRGVSPDAGLHVFQILMRTGLPTLLLRHGRETVAGPLEQEVALAARIAGFPIEWHVPAPGGREEVFHRDLEMISAADLVLAVFPPDREAGTGTEHLIDKAMDRRVPAYAFEYTGCLERVGEYDPDDTWGRVIQG